MINRLQEVLVGEAGLLGILLGLGSIFRHVLLRVLLNLRQMLVSVLLGGTPELLGA